MATRTIADGGGNYNAAATWVEGFVPTSADDVVATATSGQLTVNVASEAKTVNFTNYTNTLTMTAQLEVSGSVTLVAAMTIAGTAELRIDTTGTLTSNGKTWPNNMQIFTGGTTVTFADDWTIDGSLTISNAVTNGQTVSVGGNFSSLTATNSGTTSYVLNGTGNLRLALQLSNNLTINTAGTITMNTAATNLYGVGTFTYTAGTVVTTGSTLSIRPSCTFNTDGIAWNNVLIENPGTLTLSSKLDVDGLLTIGTGVSAITVNGADIVASAGFTTTGTTANHTGTSRIVMDGTGTIQMSAKTTGTNQLEILIDTTGTITFGTIVQAVKPIIYKRGLLAGNILGMPKTISALF